MADIIPLFGKPTSEPTATGEVRCHSCDHVWQAVAPVGTHTMECPSCGDYKGRWRKEFAPAEGAAVLECMCGSQLFYITPDAAGGNAYFCRDCGHWESMP